MTSAELVFKDAFAPVLGPGKLALLRAACRGDDERLTQGSTTTPPPLMCVQKYPVEAACALGFCGWQGEGLATVGEVEAFFAEACREADGKLGEPAACRWFLNYWDNTPRGEALATLAGWIDDVLGADAAESREGAK